MIGFVVFYVKAPPGFSEAEMKTHKEMMELHNKDLFHRLRKRGFEFMFVPTEFDGSHVDVCFFNAPPGLEQEEEME
jgi:hypothetical protein